jgi:hypothetical protein
LAAALQTNRATKVAKRGLHGAGPPLAGIAASGESIAVPAVSSIVSPKRRRRRGLRLSSRPRWAIPAPTLRSTLQRLNLAPLSRSNKRRAPNEAGCSRSVRAGAPSERGQQRCIWRARSDVATMERLAAHTPIAHPPRTQGSLRQIAQTAARSPVAGSGLARRHPCLSGQHD